jgi:ABC-2 type transport system ATP-binding protein
MKKIELSDVNKAFKNEQVLKNINLLLEDNKIYGFTGRNGSGKSILFKIICGYVMPDSGIVKIDGKVLGKDMDFPDELGALIETPGFIWYQSAYENLIYLAKIRNKINGLQVKEAIRLVGLEPESKKWVGKYSLGMKQRLGIAQAIMEQPELLILDEPMNGLDEHGVEDMRQLLLNYKRKGRMILITSHHPEDIESLCDEVFEMKNGCCYHIKQKERNQTADAVEI